jgi:CHASE3 domain sensor protein
MTSQGYLLTAEDRYLDLYQRALTRFRADLAQLDALAEALIASDVVRFKALTNTKLSELEETIRLRRRWDTDAALAMVRTDAGKRTMDQLRTLTDNMVKTESEAVRLPPRASVPVRDPDLPSASLA